jgi:hypothetical protein
LVLTVCAIGFIREWIARTRERERDRARTKSQHLVPFEEEAYQQWLRQRQIDQMALAKERVRIENLSPKAFAQLVADLPSIRCSVESLLEMAERQLLEGNAKVFWDMISKLDGMLCDGIPAKVWAIKRQAGVGRAREREQAETLEQEAKRFAERMQSLVTRAKGLQTFAQEHAVRYAYEEREWADLKKQAYLRTDD